MNKYILPAILLLIFNGCSKSPTAHHETENSSWIFVSNEGQFCSEDFGMDCTNTEWGSISMINSAGQIKSIKDVGNTVQSLLVHNDFLYVVINQDHLIKKYSINADTIIFENSFSTNNSSPREMVIANDKLYFTNWNSNDVKILNLNSNEIENNSFEINGIPEDIIFDGNYLWVTIPELILYDGNQGTQVAKIEPATGTINYIDVGRGPTSLVYHNNEIYISRTFYEFDGIDENGLWINTQIKHGTSKIGNDVIQQPYGTGSACGGTILNYNNTVYRSYDGGIAPIDNNLNIDTVNRIGNYNQDQVYHVEIINDHILFCLTNYSDMNSVKILNNIGEEIGNYQVGISPGDIAFWEK